MTAKLEILIPLLILGSAVAQGNPAGEIRHVTVARSGSATQVQVGVSVPTEPKVIVATNPPRLVLEFSNTLPGSQQPKTDIGQDGIKAIRTGLHSANPPVTRVVVDLETERAYGLTRDGNQVVLTVLPAVVASTSHGDSGAPGAAGVPLFGRLHRPKRKTPSVTDATSPTPVPPAPPSGPPIIISQTPASASSASQTSLPTSRPTAAHPNKGSLQEGVVFPGMGAPGTGVVPRGETASVVNSAQQIPVNAPAKSPEQASAQPFESVSLNKASQSVAKPVISPEQGSVKTQSSVSANGTLSVVQTMTVTAPPQTVPGSASVTQAPKPSSEASNAKQTAAVHVPTVTTTPAANSSAPSALVQVTSAENAPAPSTATTDLHVTPTPASSIPQAASALPVVPEQPSKNPVSVAAAPVQATSSGNTPPAPIIEVHASPVPAAAATEPPLPILATRQPNADLRTAFKVKYVAEGAAYLDAGRNSGLSEGMKLEIHDTDPAPANAGNEAQGVRVAALLRVVSVAESSAVTEISEPTRDVKPGDLAYLSSEDTENLVAQRSLSPTRKYPAVISFTEGDPLEEEARAEVPRPPLPEVNRARGRFGFDYSGIISHGQFASTSSNLGMVVRTDITRIGGSYWNLSGYWRGRFTSTSAPSQSTLQDLINRTYTFGLTYDNPQSPWVAGVGRLYLPWATSLDTIDGGYIGRKVSNIATVGMFAGSTPDPTSWSYAPDQQMSGTFVNFQGGSFDNLRYSSTTGMGIQMLKWKINRPFVFFENGLYYKRYFSVYSAVQADKPASNPAVTSPGAGISRSFTTLRIQPIDRLEFDVNHTYFRDIPNYDPQLIGTGLLDKFLFQGFSAGPRIEVVKQIWVYATLGKSNRSGDAKSSLNQLYGLTFGDLPFHFRADVRYSRFNSAFGDGDYKALSLSRDFHGSYRWEVLLGQQAYSSTLASSDKSKFVNANLEAPLGPHYFIQGGWTLNRGDTLNYDQWFATFGYRFDSWHRGAK
ncbi:MAG TPA: AMIN domain-containing protein [Terriglobales bacterium]|nr:AMIN domain-containing protein [Terriglobales bacterium]